MSTQLAGEGAADALLALLQMARNAAETLVENDQERRQVDGEALAAALAPFLAGARRTPEDPICREILEIFGEAAS